MENLHSAFISKKMLKGPLIGNHDVRTLFSDSLRRWIRVKIMIPPEMNIPILNMAMILSHHNTFSTSIVSTKPSGKKMGVS